MWACIALWRYCLLIHKVRSILFYCIICWILPHTVVGCNSHTRGVGKSKRRSCKGNALTATSLMERKSVYLNISVRHFSFFFFFPPPWHPVLSPKSAKRSQRIYVLAPRVWGFALHLAKCKLTSPCPSGDRKPDTLSRSKWWHVSMCDKEQQDFGKETPVALMQ